MAYSIEVKHVKELFGGVFSVRIKYRPAAFVTTNPSADRTPGRPTGAIPILRSAGETASSIGFLVRVRFRRGAMRTAARWTRELSLQPS